MNYSRADHHVLTNIKQEIQNKNRHKYQQTKNKQRIHYYLLYNQQIVNIQRWFRNCVVKRNQKMEVRIMKEIERKENLKVSNMNLLAEVQRNSQMRMALLNMDEGNMVANMKKQLELKLRKALESTLDEADQMCKNNSKAKHALTELKNQKNIQNQTKAEIQALNFELICHTKRKKEWQHKLTQIRRQIMQKKERIHEYSNRLSSHQQSNNQ